MGLAENQALIPQPVTANGSFAKKREDSIWALAPTLGSGGNFVTAFLGEFCSGIGLHAGH